MTDCWNSCWRAELISMLIRCIYRASSFIFKSLGATDQYEFEIENVWLIQIQKQRYFFFHLQSAGSRQKKEVSRKIKHYPIPIPYLNYNIIIIIRVLAFWLNGYLLEFFAPKVFTSFPKFLLVTSCFGIIGLGWYETVIFMRQHHVSVTTYKFFLQ